MKDKNVFGRRMKMYRCVHGLSLQALANKMCGLVTKQALSKYERGEMRPSMTVVNAIAHVLNIKSVMLWNDPKIRIEFIEHQHARPKWARDLIGGGLNHERDTERCQV